jgi:hypothetical protein
LNASISHGLARLKGKGGGWAGRERRARPNHPLGQIGSEFKKKVL